MLGYRQNSHHLQSSDKSNSAKDERKIEQNQEVITCYLEKINLEKEIVINRHYSIKLNGSQGAFTDELEVSFTLLNGI